MGFGAGFIQRKLTGNVGLPSDNYWLVYRCPLDIPPAQESEKACRTRIGGENSGPPDEASLTRQRLFFRLLLDDTDSHQQRATHRLIPISRNYLIVLFSKAKNVQKLGRFWLSSFLFPQVHGPSSYGHDGNLIRSYIK